MLKYKRIFLNLISENAVKTLPKVNKRFNLRCFSIYYYLLKKLIYLLST